MRGVEPGLVKPEKLMLHIRSRAFLDHAIVGREGALLVVQLFERFSFLEFRLVAPVRG